MAGENQVTAKNDEDEAIKAKLLQDFKEFLEEFKNESDRAAVLLGAAKLDFVLYQILSKRLIPNTGSKDELFEGEAPLSTFNAKIHLAYRMGIIDDGLARALHLIRRIRNAFAHEVSGCNLDSGAHRDRIKELVGPYEATRVFMDFKNAFFQDKEGPRADFYTILGIIVARLEYSCQTIAPIKIKDAWPLLPS